MYCTQTQIDAVGPWIIAVIDLVDRVTPQASTGVIDQAESCSRRECLRVVPVVCMCTA